MNKQQYLLCVRTRLTNATALFVNSLKHTQVQVRRPCFLCQFAPPPSPALPHHRPTPTRNDNPSFYQQPLPRRLSNPETVLLETTATAAAAAAAATELVPPTGSNGDFNAIIGADSRSPAAATATATAGAVAGSAVVVAQQEPLPRRKKRRKGKEPEILLEGDLLVNTPKMVGLVWSSLVLNAVYLVQV